MILPMLTFFVSAILLAAQLPQGDFSDSQKIVTQNAILAKVNGSTFSVIDVRKQMDLIFHQHYGNLAQSTQARYQFYETSWRRTLMELVDNELILSDAADKEIKINDGEVREELEARFGPNVLVTLDKIGLSFDEAWKLLKNEMIVRRMSWWFVHSKAMQNVTPSEIRQAYRTYLKEHPPYQELTYQIISIRGADPKEQAEKIYQFLAESNKNPDEIGQELSSVDPSAQISNVYTVSDLEISEAHRNALSLLGPLTYSEPHLQKSRSDHQTVARIFYLSSRVDHPAPPFETLSANLREQLIQKTAGKESQAYLAKLRKHYGFDDAYLRDQFPDDFHPFSIQ